MTAAFWRFRSVCEEDFYKVLNDYLLKPMLLFFNGCEVYINILRYTTSNNNKKRQEKQKTKNVNEWIIS